MEPATPASGTHRPADTLLQLSRSQIAFLESGGGQGRGAHSVNSCQSLLPRTDQAQPDTATRAQGSKQGAS